MAQQCAEPRCARGAHKDGYCGTCLRIRERGLPWAESVWIARRLANVKRDGDCIIWQGAPNNMGYGKVSVQNDPTAPGREEAAHRWFYKRLRGPIPEGMVLDHLCRRPLCVNPDHLEPVTLAENTRRGALARGFLGNRTHCGNGHEWVPENLLLVTGGDPEHPTYRCRPCNTERARRRNGHKPRVRMEAA